MMIKSWMLGAALAVVASAPALANVTRAADGIGYYIGVDSQQNLTSGIYSGMANPNANRLTVLLDHGNHFHGIGAYSYTGGAAAPVVVNTNTNNRLPELSSRTNEDNSALAMVAGSGTFAGSWVSASTGNSASEEYGYLGIASIQSLSGRSPAADVLFGSSSNRWNGSYADVHVGLKLESISSGLTVAAGGVSNIFDGSTVFALGSLDDFTFLPTFHIAQTATEGIYSASFSLVNLGTGSAVLDGGTFHYDFAVAAPVPEPHTVAMLAAGGLVLLGKFRRQLKSGQQRD